MTFHVDPRLRVLSSVLLICLLTGSHVCRAAASVCIAPPPPSPCTDWRRKHKADIARGERHFFLSRAPLVIKALRAKVAKTKKREADAKKALAYWINAQMGTALRGWRHNVRERIENRKALRKAVMYMQNRLAAMALTTWR